MSSKNAERSLDEKLQDISHILADTHGPWQKRHEALKSMGEAIQGGAQEESLAGTQAFEKALNKHAGWMKTGLSAQLKDLRSEIVKQAVITISVCSRSLKNGFKKIAVGLFPAIIETSIARNGTIRAHAQHCGYCVLECCNSKQLMRIILDTLNRTKVKTEQEVCLEFLRTTLTFWNISEVLPNHGGLIEDAVVYGLKLATPNARESAANCFWLYVSVFPKRQALFLAELDGRSRRIVERAEKNDWKLQYKPLLDENDSILDATSTATVESESPRSPKKEQKKHVGRSSGKHTVARPHDAPRTVEMRIAEWFSDPRRYGEALQNKVGLGVASDQFLPAALEKFGGAVSLVQWVREEDERLRSELGVLLGVKAPAHSKPEHKQPHHDSADLLATGHKNAAAGKWGEAAEAFSKLVDDPNLATRISALVGLGNAQLKGKDFDAASRSFAKAAAAGDSVSTDLFAAHFGRGQINSTQHRYAEALENFDDALRYRPGHVEAMGHREDVLRELKMQQRRDEEASGAQHKDADDAADSTGAASQTADATRDDSSPPAGPTEHEDAAADIDHDDGGAEDDDAGDREYEDEDEVGDGHDDKGTDAEEEEEEDNNGGPDDGPDDAADGAADGAAEDDDYEDDQDQDDEDPDATAADTANDEANKEEPAR